MSDLVGNPEDRFSRVMALIVLTQIRLFLERQSDYGLHHLLFLLHVLKAFLYSKINVFELKRD